MAGLFGSIAERVSGKSAMVLSEFPDFLMGRESRSGALVNWRTALETTTVLGCARVISEGIAQVPLKLYRPRKDGRGSDEAKDHPLYDILSRRPNGWQTSFEFRETLALHLVLTNNAYCYINRVGGRIYELIPFEPNRVTVTRKKDFSLSYELLGDDGDTRTLQQADVWHLRGPSWNSWMGMEAVKLAREAIGLSIELEAAHARLHKNGVQPSGFYSVETVLTPDQQRSLAKWIKEQAGGDNRGMPLVLDRGAKWLSQQMSGVDSQHLETRRFQIEEVCRALRVMPIMVGYSDKTATYASAEQMFLAHVTHTLGPWGKRFEDSIDVNLLDPKDGGIYARFNWAALLRGSMVAQAQFFSTLFNVGAYSPNDIRADLDKNPVDGGDEYFRPAATVPVPFDNTQTPAPRAKEGT